MTSLQLIDAGRSRRGWSRIGQLIKCAQLFAYQQRLNLQLIPASALTRGSMGHVMQAHLHAAWGCEQGGVMVDTEWHTDASVFMDPYEAVASYCDANGGHEHLDRMVETFDEYLKRHPEPPGRIIAVEWPLDAVLGYVEDVWGLWVIHPEEANKVDHVCETIKAYDSRTIRVTPLEMPGHPDHGKPIYISRRCDMVVEERNKRTFIWDHKHQAMVSATRSVDAYAIDGGFAFFRLMGQQVFGSNFGGLLLNLIQTTSPFKVARPTVPKTPHRDDHLPQLLWEAEHRLALLDTTNEDHWRWPKAMSETSCYGRYGACGGLKLCFYGESGTRYLR